MIRIILIWAAVMVFPWTMEICNYYYPVKGEPYDTIWDNLKHMYYLASIGLVTAAHWFKPGKYEKFARFGVYIYGLGMLLPAMIDKKFNSDDPEKHWYDWAGIALAAYAGVRCLFPGIHRKITVPFTGTKLYNKIYGTTVR